MSRPRGPLHVTAALHVTGGSRSWRIGAPLQMRHAPHATQVSNGAPGLKSQKRQAPNRKTYIESVERVLWRTMRHPAMR
jgi:hypothetical protein